MLKGCEKTALSFTVGRKYNLIIPIKISLGITFGPEIPLLGILSGKYTNITIHN